MTQNDFKSSFKWLKNDSKWTKKMTQKWPKNDHRSGSVAMATASAIFPVLRHHIIAIYFDRWLTRWTPSSSSSPHPPLPPHVRHLPTQTANYEAELTISNWTVVSGWDTTHAISAQSEWVLIDDRHFSTTTTTTTATTTLLLVVSRVKLTCLTTV